MVPRVSAEVRGHGRAHLSKLNDLTDRPQKGLISIIDKIKKKKKKILWM